MDNNDRVLLVEGAVVRVSFMVDATAVTNEKCFQNCAASLKRQLNYTGRTASHYLLRLRSKTKPI